MKLYFAALCALVVAHATVAQELPKGHPTVDMHSQTNKPAAELTNKGKVLSTINVSQYTYIEVMQDKDPLWLATTTVPVKKDDIIRFENGMNMTNYYSNSLKRNFPSIRFVGTVVVSDEK